MKNPLIEMYQNDKTLFLTWGIGSSVGGYSGVRPPQFLNILTTGDMDLSANLVHLGWAVITAAVATSVSFLVTRLWKKVFADKDNTAS